MITSPANQKVRYARSLLRRQTRRQENRCLIEGVRLVEAALEGGNLPVFLFYVPELVKGKRASSLLASLNAEQTPCYEITPSILAALTDTVTPQGMVAVVHCPPPRPRERITLALVVDGLRDPGNLGTLLRTAVAAGVERLLLAPGTIDSYNAKVLRSGMGAHFQLPPEHLTWTDITQAVTGLDVWLADTQGDQPYDQVDWVRPCALIVGGEASGASAQAVSLARGRVCIPLRSGVESLNATIAASVLLFEADRQRRQQGKRFR